MIDKIFAGISKIMGSKSERDIKKIQPIVDEIKSYEDELKQLTDDELKGKTEEFKQEIQGATAATQQKINELKSELEQIHNAESDDIDRRNELETELEELDKEWLEITDEVLDDILPEAFAVLKETCRRFVGKSWKVAGNETEWNMVPYDVQLIGAVVLHQGNISEMKTGEGKTLVAIFPTYLNALTGRGVHIVTVNSYLAERDCEWNEPIFNFHGIHVDCVDRYQPNTEARRNAYRADVTYGTNSEFGFDYLRDNMVINKDQLVQRGHHYTIVDEVDSVLIDEARTPLIISGPVPQQDNQNQKFTELKPRVEKLVEAQKKLIAKFLHEAEEAYAAGDEQKAGLALFRARRGFPKSKKFQKMMQDPTLQKLTQQTEYLYLQDQGKNMHIVDEAMYYAVDMKQNTIELTEMGRELITPSNEDPEFFVIPDMGTETSVIEEELENKEREQIQEIENNAGFSDDYKQQQIEKVKEEIKKERSDRMSGLYRLFSERSERIHSVNQLLKAYTLFERDDEYIVTEGKVQIVDEHTGRVLPGRRYSDGLHQAIEAKENVKVEAATQTYATITLQNYFRMYHKLAGMTGTASTEEGEFAEIYDLEVVEIPTNVPVQRIDREDLVFRTKRERYNAAVDKIREYNDKGQPVLVGTTSVEVSEMLSRMLKRSGIRHNVLNAKQHKSESEIVKEAGQKGSVTIATNMAGRGTDIKLGEGVRELGGLAILGTERHESRRIDLQLRGRAGRQGDPGESQFYVSLEDDLMRLFGSERVANVMDRLKFEDGEVIQHPWVSKSLERAQKKVEQNNFSIRKRQLEYDDVLNNQRNVIYGYRRKALLGDGLSSMLLNMLEDMITAIVNELYKEGDYDGIRERILRQLAVDVEVDRERWSSLREDGVIDLIFEEAVKTYQQKEERLTTPFYRVIKQVHENQNENKPTSVQIMFTDGVKRMRVVVNVEDAVQNEGREVVRALERSAVLSVIDEKWMEHLRELDTVKEGIGLRAFGQKDPLLEYKREAFNMFSQLLEDINSDVISLVWRAVPEVASDPNQLQQAKQPARAKVDLDKLKTQHDSAENMGLRFGGGDGEGDAQRAAASAGRGEKAKRQPVVVEEKVGRNDPCPCGSGKKYKHCHGR
ncbi:preprotein translocase subunit SecA [Natronogracilivirga saccharolytica]|uniref:Protein translocase subunit SecA n=1 Tax=Natronogracilivirga saccharolytica TaxID=2812953 RepID=A0A8J7S7X8_9BACT|nr:preprotein translocase subunit SecA [Natronogracilivirga saccharolytica]MBP3191801.1 preprotein translocase subunit SecA [Natronogracilivirga saccharolytica]